MDRDAVGIGLWRVDRLDRLVRHGVAHDHGVGAHAGQVPLGVVTGEDDVLADFAIGHGDHVDPVGIALQVQNVEGVLAEHRQIRLARILVVEDVMVVQARGQWDIRQNLAKTRRFRVDIHDRDAFLAKALVRLGLVIDHGQNLGLRGQGQKPEGEYRAQGQTTHTFHVSLSLVCVSCAEARTGSLPPMRYDFLFVIEPRASLTGSTWSGTTWRCRRRTRCPRRLCNRARRPR